MRLQPQSPAGNGFTTLASFLDIDGEFWKTHGGLPADLVAGEGLRESMLTSVAVTAEEILEVRDVTQETRFANDTLLQERGIRFFAGVPLRSSDGHVVGIMCITDTEPHQVTERAKALLRSLGERLTQEVERRSLQTAEAAAA